ncbi:hypothetical protein LTS07_011390 [Exophiala sideris]|uniref:xylan 1,4-beta-xylosidase n=1 Tax=Exophiala sideris TaxID=1016849 RepID=A0ABR0IUR5_9EURO|nr:hypothetical protein LTS07_011390 [Exophiala sideris]KAK5048392.1 hypothetical protein LTR69_011404 [Exophiala sideris]
MFAPGGFLLLLGLIAPVVLGQFVPFNQSGFLFAYELDETDLATISLSFPDCQNGPLAGNIVCTASANYRDRTWGLINLLTIDELIVNTRNTAPGVPRLGLPPYQVWNEALHRLDQANFSDFVTFSRATIFAQPILSTAALNRTFIHTIADIISTQGRALKNAGKYGLDSYAPNINGFRRGVEPDYIKIVATPRRFAGYDLESWNGTSRLSNDLIISNQDLAGYYTPQFKAAIRDARANSFMCSYNGVNGVPSCANSYLLQTLLRNTWGFSNYDGYVSADCDSVVNVWEPHYYAYNLSVASSESLLAGTDIDCGHAYAVHLNESIIAGAVAPSDIAQGVFRLYSNLVRLGFFDWNNSVVYRELTWEDVVSTDAQNISYESAVQGITLLKNDGTLPL